MNKVPNSVCSFAQASCNGQTTIQCMVFTVILYLTSEELRGVALAVPAFSLYFHLDDLVVLFSYQQSALSCILTRRTGRTMVCSYLLLRRCEPIAGQEALGHVDAFQAFVGVVVPFPGPHRPKIAPKSTKAPPIRFTAPRESPSRHSRSRAKVKFLHPARPVEVDSQSLHPNPPED